MKQLVEPDPAPALTRGLHLIGLLTTDGQQSLEQLAGKTGWPKSSVLRYLTALEQAGVARQDVATRKWRAQQQLQPVRRERDSLLREARSNLANLAEATRQCVELYEFANDQTVLIDRAEPEGAEIAIQARIGFVRNLDELEAVSSLCFAFGGLRPSAYGLWRWENGEKAPVRARLRNEVIARARAEQFACDHDFNENGIRRFAIPLLEESQLLGTIVIAQRQTPRAQQEVAVITSALKSFNHNPVTT